MAHEQHHGYLTCPTGLRLHYVEQGEGPLVLLLHGFPEFWYSWRHQLPCLAEAGYHVVAPDLRGYNLSDKPQGIQAYAPHELVGDIVDILDHFEAKQATIVGHDWGGVLAFLFAHTHPERTERLAILNAPHPHAAAHSIRQRNTPNFRQLLRSWYIVFFQIPGAPEWLLKRDDFGFLKELFQGKHVRPGSFTDEDVQRYREALCQPGALQAGINYYRMIFRQSLRNLLQWKFPPHQALSMPGLVIWGEDDQVLGKELAYNLGTYFSGPFALRYIAQAGHWIQQEAPQLCNQYLLDFVQNPSPLHS